MKTPLKFLSSLAAGITLGLLFAPKKGTDLRRELSSTKDKMGDFGKELLAAGQDASAEVQKFLQRKEVKEFLTSGKAEVTDFVSMLKKKGEVLSQKAQQELKSLTSGLGHKAAAVKKTVRRKKKAVVRKVQTAKKAVGNS